MSTANANNVINLLHKYVPVQIFTYQLTIYNQYEYLITLYHIYFFCIVTVHEIESYLLTYNIFRYKN